MERLLLNQSQWAEPASTCVSRWKDGAASNDSQRSCLRERRLLTTIYLVNDAKCAQSTSPFCPSPCLDENWWRTCEGFKQAVFRERIFCRSKLPRRGIAAESNNRTAGGCDNKIPSTAGCKTPVILVTERLAPAHCKILTAHPRLKV